MGETFSLVLTEIHHLYYNIALNDHLKFILQIEPLFFITSTGEIPSGIGNLTHLEELSIRDSLLTGKVPFSIFNISTLEIIDFSNNSLSGSFPVGMFYNLPALKQMDLSSNQLNGSIPFFIWGCKALVDLGLKHNNFTGGISDRIGNLTSLRKIILDDNKLKGLNIRYFK